MPVGLPSSGRWARRRALAPCLTPADPVPGTVVDPAGVVRSVQAVEVALPAHELERRWSPRELERLGGAYFHHLRRDFLGVVRAVPTASGPGIVALGPPLVLLRFGPPRHHLETDHAEVSWPIRGGLLAAPARPGEADRGRLAVVVQRLAEDGVGLARIRVALVVEGFRPTVAALLGPRVYLETQARVHLLVAHRYLAKLPRYFGLPAPAPAGAPAAAQPEAAQPLARQ